MKKNNRIRYHSKKGNFYDMYEIHCNSGNNYIKKDLNRGIELTNSESAF